MVAFYSLKIPLSDIQSGTGFGGKIIFSTLSKGTPLYYISRDKSTYGEPTYWHTGTVPVIVDNKPVNMIMPESRFFNGYEWGNSGAFLVGEVPSTEFPLNIERNLDQRAWPIMADFEKADPSWANRCNPDFAPVPLPEHKGKPVAERRVKLNEMVIANWSPNLVIRELGRLSQANPDWFNIVDMFDIPTEI